MGMGLIMAKPWQASARKPAQCEHAALSPVAWTSNPKPQTLSTFRNKKPYRCWNREKLAQRVRLGCSSLAMQTNRSAAISGLARMGWKLLSFQLFKVLQQVLGLGLCGSAFHSGDLPFAELSRRHVAGNMICKFDLPAKPTSAAVGSVSRLDAHELQYQD